MISFLLGAVSMASFIAALFFLRYWRDTRDSLFGFFAASFFLEAGNRVLVSLSGDLTEALPVLYTVRLLSYLLILAGIVHKNRPRA